MEDNKISNHQMEINDLIDLAITNAAIRRGLVEGEDCLALSDDEATKVTGGATISTDVKSINTKTPPTVAGFKPICPPLIVGLIAQDYNKLA
ncbi:MULTISPECIES: hypothetical protein [Nostocales]|uniref:Uncharacterized protein n=3 Tax=Nostocales TaxID=1161 RepID=A0A0C1QUX9_9CYAN|nr:hypothetical protein [Tolypothrix bouteillei]KAF3888915.1 hypothetical protein DA73_0400028095 [Tolypothrix bouteillei VB521301]